MDTKVQKIKIEYSRFRTNGFLLDFIIKSLDIKQQDQKTFQRFIKEKDISSQEYHDTLNIVIEDILYIFIDRDNNIYKDYETKINLFFKAYNFIKLHIETLSTAQKELDTIVLIHFILPFVSQLESSIKSKISISNLIPTNSESSIQQLFNIISNSLDGDLQKLLKEIINNDLNKSIGYDSVNKAINNWISGKTIPTNQHIDLISEISKYFNEYSQQELKNYFLIAKFIQYLYDKSIEYFGYTQTKQLIEIYRFYVINKNNPDFSKKDDIKVIIENAILQIYNNTYIKYSKQLDLIYKDTSISKVKTEESEKRLLNNFTNFEQKYDTEKNPDYSFLKARYYAQKREYKKATEYYLIALKYGKNCMGVHTKSIIKEGLFVSAQDTRLDKNKPLKLYGKGAFTKFYKEAYFYKLIDDLPDEINIYFLNDMKKQFNIYFKNLFPNTKKANDKQLSKDLGIFLIDDVKKIKPDYKKPNKPINVKKNPESQLCFFAGIGEYEIVKKLIENGADVNYKRFNDNYTPLIASLENKITPNHIKIAKYLIPTMSQEILNAKLPKKKETALSYAINRGLVDIVELLIKYDVDLEQKISLDEQTALYYSMGIISKIKNGLKNIMDCSDNSKFIKTNPYENEVELKKMINTHNIPNLIFDDEKKKYLILMQKNKLFQSIQDTIEKSDFFLKYWYHNDLNNAYKIIDLILENTNNIDIPYKHGITPLIFATELNEVELVKKLLDKGANPDFYTNQNARAYDYATRNKNEELMDTLI